MICNWAGSINFATDYCNTVNENLSFNFELVIHFFFKHKNLYPKKGSALALSSEAQLIYLSNYYCHNVNKTSSFNFGVVITHFFFLKHFSWKGKCESTPETCDWFFIWILVIPWTKIESFNFEVVIAQFFFPKIIVWMGGMGGWTDRRMGGQWFFTPSSFLKFKYVNM